MYKKNDLIELNITDLSTDGDGIGKTDSFTWFVKDTVPGDTVTAAVMKVKKNYGFARLVEVNKKSDARIRPRCPVARQCGGCSLQNMSYEKQLIFKQNKVENNLKRIGGFELKKENGKYPQIYDIISMDDPWRYRNKAIVPFGRDKNGRVVYGFYARHSHDIISCDDCLIGSAENRAILEVIKKYYSDQIRNVLIRKCFHTDMTMVCIIASAEKLKFETDIVERLVKDCSVDTVILNINKENTNTVLGEKERILYGNGYVEDMIGELRFRISSKSFFQINPVQVEKLYDCAVGFADLQEDETAWDLYCGTGTITLSLARKAKKVYGVEIVEQAVRDARKNAEINGITNAEFYAGKAEEVLPEKIAKAADLIVVDPPRKGCDEKCIETMLKMKPKKIVYVSCDSATLARDLRILCDGNYELKKVQPVDMFPHTPHVETVALLQREEV